MSKASGHDRRRRLLDQAVNRLPHALRPPVDVAGWTSAEFLARLQAPRGTIPPRRLGRDAARRVNALANVLPGEAVVFARAITDTAPPAGERAHPTLRSILENYLPESLRAYAASRAQSPNAAAEQLLTAQLRLLHQVAVDVQQADSHQNHLDLRIQDTFLKERFAQLTPGALSLPGIPEGVAAPATPQPPDQPPEAPSYQVAGSAVPSGAAHLTVDANPVVLFPAHPRGERKLFLRLAIPKKHPTSLVVVVQNDRGEIDFRRTETRRWLAQRRSTGFPTPQADLTLPVNITGIRRLVVLAYSPARTAPTRCVLFARDSRSQTSMSTLLAGRSGAAVTVVCSGYATSEGLVLRNESALYPDLRSACTGFGYDSITWLDASTPIV